MSEMRIVLLTEENWRAMKARVAALETPQRLLIDQLARIHATLLYPNDLEARVTTYELKRSELLKAHGFDG